MERERWAIIDDNGIIDDGPEDEMRAQFDRYVSGEDELSDRLGDLLLVKIVATA